METQELIEMLNRDLADEHAAVLRYLVHGWMEGEDTALGSSLISRSREEMWHMHWLGLAIGGLGGEPNLIPAGYPYDPTNRATIFRSYVEYEEKLIPHYNGEADKVDHPHIKRVLQRESWESAIHARKFQRILGKLKPEEANGVPGGEIKLPADFLDKLQNEVFSKYNVMLQHIRYSWVMQKESFAAWRIMDESFEMMKQIAHFAEDVAGSGVSPQFITDLNAIDCSTSLQQALSKSRQDILSALDRHVKLREDAEAKKHGGFAINLDLTVHQEKYEAAELEYLKNK